MKKLLIIGFSVLLLTSCGLGERLDKYNSIVVSDLGSIITDIDRMILKGQLTEEYGTEDDRNSEYSFSSLYNKPYGQTFLFRKFGDISEYQIMGFICNGIGEGEKVVLIRGNYKQRKAKNINIISISDDNFYIYISKNKLDLFKIGDITNLGTIGMIRDDGRISFKKEIDIGDKEKYMEGGYGGVSTNMDTGKIYIKQKVEKDINHISLLDTPVGLILDENGEPYINNQIIGECTEEEVYYLYR